MPQEQGSEGQPLASHVLPVRSCLGLWATCYALKPQDGEYYGGMREAVLERGGYHCPVCNASVEHERSIIMHHRVPGKSVLSLVVSLRIQPSASGWLETELLK